MISTDPSRGDDRGRRDEVRAAFNLPLNELTIQNAVTVYRDSGEAVFGDILLEGETTIVFVPSHPFLLLEQYTVCLAAGIESVSGRKLKSSQVWSFCVRDGIWGPRSLLAFQAETLGLTEFSNGSSAATYAPLLDSSLVNVYERGNGWNLPTLLTSSRSGLGGVSMAGSSVGELWVALNLDVGIAAQPHLAVLRGGSLNGLEPISLEGCASDLALLRSDTNAALLVWGKEPPCVIEGSIWGACFEDISFPLTNLESPLHDLTPGAPAERPRAGLLGDEGRVVYARGSELWSTRYSDRAFDVAGAGSIADFGAPLLDYDVVLLTEEGDALVTVVTSAREVYSLAFTGADEVWSPAVFLGGPASSVELVASGGRAAALWWEADATGPGSAAASVAMHEPDAGWADLPTPFLLEDDNPIQEPVLLMNSSGEVRLVYHQRRNFSVQADATQLVVQRHAPADGWRVELFETARSGGLDRMRSVRAASNALGEATVVWTVFDEDVPGSAISYSREFE